MLELILILILSADDYRAEFQACMRRAQTTEAQRVCHVEAAACFQKGSSGRSSLRR